MNHTLRSLVAVALLAPALAPAQTTTTTTTTTLPAIAPTVEVTSLAPQLIAFAGGQSNFDSLVNGLALGTPVTLVTTLPTGQIQTVTFTPQGAMTALQIAQTLENARQSLITRGIGTPTSQQVAISLTGGTLPTQSGNVQVAGLLPAANQPSTIQPATAAAGATGAAVNPVATTTSPSIGTPSPSALIQGQTGAGGTTPPSPAQIIQNQREGNISNTPTTATAPTATTPTTTPTTTAPATTTPSATTPAATSGGVTAPATSAPLAPAR